MEFKQFKPEGVCWLIVAQIPLLFRAYEHLVSYHSSINHHSTILRSHQRADTCGEYIVLAIRG